MLRVHSASKEKKNISVSANFLCRQLWGWFSEVFNPRTAPVLPCPWTVPCWWLQFWSFFSLILCSLSKHKLVYYSIFTVWLQCPLLPLRIYCRLESFAGSFYQYPLEYNFKASLSSVWYAGVGVGSQPEMCSDDLWILQLCQVKYPHDVRVRYEIFFSLSFSFLV